MTAIIPEIVSQHTEEAAFLPLPSGLPYPSRPWIYLVQPL